MALVLSLKRICIKAVSRNFDSLIIENSTSSPGKYEWSYPGFIPSPVANDVLRELSLNNQLKERHLCLFTNKHVRLNSVYLCDMVLRPSSLTFLKDFTLFSFEAVNVMGIDFRDLMQCFNPETKSNLHTLNVSIALIETEKIRRTVHEIGQLQYLQKLNISGTRISTEDLELLLTCLPQLTHLDISKTGVDDIQCLLSIKDKLEGLIMNAICDVPEEFYENAAFVIAELKELQVLEVSKALGSFPTDHIPNANQLIASATLPNIRYLDVSRNTFGLSIDEIRVFIENHPTLEVIVFLTSRRREIEGLTQLIQEYPRIEIVGGGDNEEERILKSLRFYKNRPYFFSDILDQISLRVSYGYNYNYRLFEFLVELLEEEHRECITIAFILSTFLHRNAENNSISNIPRELLDKMRNVSLRLSEDGCCMKAQVSGLDLMSALIQIDELREEYRIFLKSLFKNLYKSRRYQVRIKSLDNLASLFEKIPHADKIEISRLHFNMRGLIRVLAEKYLSNKQLGEFYLAQIYDFDPNEYNLLEDSSVDIISLLKTLVESSWQACMNFKACGGIGLFKLISANYISRNDFSSVPKRLEELLEYICGVLNPERL